MKRIFATLAIGLSMLALLAACGSDSSRADSPNGKGASATVESQTSETQANSQALSDESKSAFGALVIEFVDQGVVVGQGDAITQPFLSVPGATIILGQETVQVFNYPSPAAAQAEADLVDPTGFTVGTTSISWIAPPHFYLKDTLLVLYIGGDSPVIDVLETVLGPQFAGATASDPVQSLNAKADAEVGTYLSLMGQLTSGLIRFANRGASGASVKLITDITSQLENYMVLFSQLKGDQWDYVMGTYSEQFRQSAEKVAELTIRIQENSDQDDSGQILLALSRIPAFVLTSASTSTSNTSTTGESQTTPTGYISSLLLPGEVEALSGGAELKTEVTDLKSMAAEVDPAQVENLVSFDSLSIDTADGFRGLTLTTILFDSENAAIERFDLITGQESGMQSHSDSIGDASSFLEANEGGTGSLVAFKKGDWVVMLHTIQRSDVAPFLDLSEVETLAMTVADRL
ncbi:MAG: hypothetical protein BZY75_00710 [SAR202 cluster bacterium Io17-Chloro-G7]|nr:MAG: hypothetical protein BZY75_00710 [SAR202 cluster bacterium Io17-Chloro-G7]